jgi:hypothetical protein
MGELFDGKWSLLSMEGRAEMSGQSIHRDGHEIQPPEGQGEGTSSGGAGGDGNKLDRR